MPMRTDCKHYETRSYGTGETVRKCNLDLAPEAPWRCPEGCVMFEKRLADVTWQHGSLITPPTPPEPPGIGNGAAEVLDAAEEIVNSAGIDILDEYRARDRDRLRPRPSFWRRRRGS